MFDHVKNAKLFRDGGHYFLDVRYETEDDEKVMEYHFPRVRLPIEYADVMNVDYHHDDLRKPQYQLILPRKALLCYEGTATFIKDKKDGDRENITIPNAYFAECVIKEKTKEMTIAEIEKKLGHKVKIVESH